MNAGVRAWRRDCWENHGFSASQDFLAVEEPLEIRVAVADRTAATVSITMRTPGNDRELALGFLLSEGVLDRVGSVRVELDENRVTVILPKGADFDIERLSRHVTTSSSCGVCGKTSIDQVRVAGEALTSQIRVAATCLTGLPDRLREAQQTFAKTGGLHASALFSPDGDLLNIREDVGRHNALDKLVGALWSAGAVPASDAVLLLSGRVSYELVQKSFVAGIPILAAIGAPSSLAVELADQCGMTLVGFLKPERFNLYCHRQRVQA